MPKIQEPTADRMVGTVTCDDCGQRHPAEFSHVAQYGSDLMYAVVCTKDYLTGYYAEFLITFS